jgi:tetratricopeptide (TPR) repeat protein
MINKRGDYRWGKVQGIVLIIFGVAGTALAVSQLKQYQKAPAFNLGAIAPEGMRVNDKASKGKPTILVFGELYNRNTIDALSDLEKVRTDLELTQKDINIYLIVAQKATAAQLREIQLTKKVKATVLHDSDRSAFGEYGVVVLPSVVVLDSEGNVSLAISGYPLSFSDMMTDAILYSLGKTTRKQFEASVQAPSGAAPVEESKLRAGRLAGLARQLYRRGYTKLAQERFAETLKLDPDYLPGRVGMARCLIKLNHLAEAAEELEKVLQKDKDHTEANLVLAQLEIIRGGEEIKAAQQRLDLVLARNPHDPEAHYLLGMVYESENKIEQALVFYKKAAQILLESQSSK